MKQLLLLCSLLLAAASLQAQDAKPWEAWQPPAVMLPQPNGFDTYLQAFALKKEIDGRVMPAVKESEPTKGEPPAAGAPPPAPPAAGAPAGGPGGPPPENPAPAAPPADYFGEGPPDMPLPQRVALYADVLKLVREGLKQECRIRMPNEYSVNGYSYFGGFRSAERLLATEAVLRRQNGDVAGAANSALDGMLLAQHAMSQRTVLSYLVGIACEAITLRNSLDRTIPLLTAPQCREMLGKMLALEQTRPRLADMIAGQLTIRLLFIKTMLTDHDQLEKLLAENRGYPNGAEIAADLTRFLGEMNTQKWEAIGREYRAWQEAVTVPYLRQPKSPPPADSYIATHESPPLHVQLKYAQGLTWLHQRELQLAVRAYLLEKGQLPQDLQALVPNYLPQVPADPFGDGPMKSIMTPNGLAVYGIGPDSVDDHGQPTRFDFVSEGDKGDMVVVISAKP